MHSVEEQYGYCVSVNRKMRGKSLSRHLLTSFLLEAQIEERKGGRVGGADGR